MNTDTLVQRRNQRRWASYRVTGDSPESDSSSPRSSRLARLAAEVAALLPVAEPARKNKKVPAERLRAIIQQLCAGKWLPASEIAALVDRDAEKLQSRFLTAMVKEGVLELRYPDVRNRPDQAYRSLSPGATAAT